MENRHQQTDEKNNSTNNHERFRKGCQGAGTSIPK